MRSSECSEEAGRPNTWGLVEVYATICGGQAALVNVVAGGATSYSVLQLRQKIPELPGRTLSSRSTVLTIRDPSGTTAKSRPQSRSEPGLRGAVQRKITVCQGRVSRGGAHSRNRRSSALIHRTPPL